MFSPAEGAADRKCFPVSAARSKHLPPEGMRDLLSGRARTLQAGYRPYRRMTQSGSTFLQTATTSRMMPSKRASSASMLSF